MKHSILRLITFLNVAFITTLHGFTGHSFYLGRPQGAHAERELVGWQTLINSSLTDNNNHVFAVQQCYGQSFNSQRISQFLFGCLPLTISGSKVANRGSTDILADYLGLPVDYQGNLCFNPTIQNVTTNFDFYCTLDSLMHGLYIRAHMPLTYTKWNLNVRENVIAAGTARLPAGYIGAGRSVRSSLPGNAGDFFCGTTRFGNKELLEFGRVCCSRNKISVADLFITTGWNAVCEDYHAGANFRLVIPTGNKPTAHYLFDPIIGNGYHWEVGAGLTTHYNFWKSCDEDHTLAVYLDANFTHLIKSKQLRSYDLINGPGSRYMVASTFITPAADLYFNAAPPVGTAAPNQYRRKLHQVINITTLESSVYFAIQADVALKFMYQYNNFQFDLGYNFWARSKEKLHCRQTFPSNASNQFGLKGDAQLYGFDAANNIPIALNVTQHNATLFGGQGAGNANYQNLNADNPVPAADFDGLLNQLTPADSAALGIPQATVNTSNPAILLTNADIDSCSALLPRALTNGIFAHVNYMWNDYCSYVPFLGFGAEMECASGNALCNSAYSQWNVWIKGGVSF